VTVRFVLDASIVITWAMGGEAHPLADSALVALQTGSAAVPAIFWYEIRNILVLNERRGRIDPSDSTQFLADLDEFDIKANFPQDSGACIALARKHALSVYDSAYLALAIHERLPLATLNRTLAAAAAIEGIPSLV